MITYREARPNDLAQLRSLDLKCHEQTPSTDDWWKQIAENTHSGVCVSCKNQVPVGMIVWERQAFQVPDRKAKTTTLHLHKLCVRPEYRNNQIGQRLLAYAHEEARRTGCPYMTISVPEYKCQPGEEDDVSEWLNKLGFNATMILPVKISLYGKEYDQFLFVFEVKV